MKKILTLLSHFLLSSSFSSNAALYNNHNNDSGLKQNMKLDLKNHSNVYNALESWHNGLTLEQDAKAKQEYEDAMNITTIKGANQGFDKYNITFNKDKLKNIQKEGLINQDVYDIWSDSSNAMDLTYKANKIVDKSEFFGGSTKLVHAYDGLFTIKNNNLHFTDEKTPNNNIKKYKDSNNLGLNFDELLDIVEKCWCRNIIKIDEYPEYMETVDAALAEGTKNIETLAYELYRTAAAAFNDGEISLVTFMEIFPETIMSDLKHTTSKNSETYAKLIIENNSDMLKAIKHDNDGNDSGVEYLLGKDIDSITSDITYWLDDIKPIPPLGKRISKWTDEDREYDKTPIYHIFKFTSNLSYAKYGSLWEYLNSNITFNLHEKFESRVGWLTNDKNFNYDFDKDQKISFLKKYWNKYAIITKKTEKFERECSSAEIYLEISDNTVNKTINFNFKSILQNENAIQNCYNYMY